MSGFVYAIAAGDLVKIGWSATPQVRLTKIRSDSSKPCTLLGYVAASLEQEAELHSLLAPWREHGEWFRCEGAVRHLIDIMPLGDAVKRRRRGRSGNALREWREANGLSATECGKRVGVSHAAISRAELGQRTPRPKLMAAIIQMTGGAVTAADFYPGAAA